MVIAEDVTHKQFVGFVEADTEEEARAKGSEEFAEEHPIYNARFRVIMCCKMPERWQGL